MTQNAAETPGAPRRESAVGARRRPLVDYKPQVLKLIHFLEQPEPLAVMPLARPEAGRPAHDAPASIRGDDA